MATLPSNSEKKAVWDAYHARHPVRVPLRWNVNCRIILLNPELNPEGYSFEQVFNDPQVALIVHTRFQEYVGTVLAETCDNQVGLPETWSVGVEGQNTCDAAYFGAPVRFRPGEVPCNEPCMGVGEIDRFMARDWTQVLDNPFIQDRLRFHAALVRAAEKFTYRERKVEVRPYALWFDGPVTLAAALLGTEFFTFMGEAPDRAREFLLFLTRAVIHRNIRMAERNGPWQPGNWGGFADDSIQLISPAMYRQVVMPSHALWLDQMSTTKPADKRRSVHLCGDATRHFKTLVDELGVVSFDTGFPVDHGALRRQLGPEIEISGGIHVSILQEGTPRQCAAEAKRILQSGIMEGGRFILQEANNLPPRVPLANLQAVYGACRQFGRYS